MTSYLYAKWHHKEPGSPSECYTELDALRNETRKVEVFPGGRKAFASAMQGSWDTRLNPASVPELWEIRSQAGLTAAAISRSEFEQKWKEARSGR